MYRLNCELRGKAETSNAPSAGANPGKKSSMMPYSVEEEPAAIETLTVESVLRRIEDIARLH